MRDNVRLQITRLYERLVALVALVWLFSTVRDNVRLQITRLNERLVALVALVWLFSNVCL